MQFIYILLKTTLENNLSLNTFFMYYLTKKIAQINRY